MKGSGARKRAALGIAGPGRSVRGSRISNTSPVTVWPGPLEVVAAWLRGRSSRTRSRSTACGISIGGPGTGTTAEASSMSVCTGRARARARARSRRLLHHDEAHRALLAHHLAHVGDPGGGGDARERHAHRNAGTGRPAARTTSRAWTSTVMRRVASGWPGRRHRASRRCARGEARRGQPAREVQRGPGARRGRGSRSGVPEGSSMVSVEPPRRRPACRSPRRRPCPGRARRRRIGARTSGPRGRRFACGRRSRPRAAPSGVWPSSCSSKPSSSGDGLADPEADLLAAVVDALPLRAAPYCERSAARLRCAACR